MFIVLIPIETLLIHFLLSIQLAASERKRSAPKTRMMMRMMVMMKRRVCSLPLALYIIITMSLENNITAPLINFHTFLFLVQIDVITLNVV